MPITLTQTFVHTSFPIADSRNTKKKLTSPWEMAMLKEHKQHQNIYTAANAALTTNNDKEWTHWI